MSICSVVVVHFLFPESTKHVHSPRDDLAWSIYKESCYSNKKKAPLWGAALIFSCTKLDDREMFAMQVVQDLRKAVHDLYKETSNRMGLALRAICNDFRPDDYKRVRVYKSKDFQLRTY